MANLCRWSGKEFVDVLENLGVNKCSYSALENAFETALTIMADSKGKYKLQTSSEIIIEGIYVNFDDLHC